MKEEVCKMVVRSAVMYDFRIVELTKRPKSELKLAKLKMSRHFSGVK